MKLTVETIVHAPVAKVWSASAARAACLRFRQLPVDLIIDDEARSGQPG